MKDVFLEKYCKVGAKLYTKDGSEFSNAVIIEEEEVSNEYLDTVKYFILTEDGRTSWLSFSDIEDNFNIHSLSMDVNNYSYYHQLHLPHPPIEEYTELYSKTKSILEEVKCLLQACKDSDIILDCMETTIEDSRSGEDILEGVSSLLEYMEP